MAIISYNRPALTARVLEAVRATRPPALFLICDGPRRRDKADGERCAAVREALEGVDWPCDVRRRYARKNHGCEATVELGLDWVFAHVDRVIVLEDDCLPDPTFFDFCDELLERYAEDERVVQIAGSNFAIPPERFGEYSYGFSTHALVWGWATWRRAWREHRADFPRTHGSGPRVTRTDLPIRLSEPSLDHLVSAPGRHYFAEVRASRSPIAFGWDSHWWLSAVARERLLVTPRDNMVHNAGFGPEATHTNSTRVMPPATATSFPLVHPEAVVLDRELARDMELALVRGNGHLARTLRQVVPNGALRSVARAVATGPVATAAMRGADKLRGAMHR